MSPQTLMRFITVVGIAFVAIVFVMAIMDSV